MTKQGRNISFRPWDVGFREGQADSRVIRCVWEACERGEVGPSDENRFRGQYRHCS